MRLVTAGVKFFFQEENLSTIIDQSMRHRIFISKTQRLATHSNQLGTSFLASDRQGSSIVEQHRAFRHINSYSPYGYFPVVDGATTLVKFNGERSDPYSELYFLGQGVRCFSAALMRFYSPDQLSPFDAGGLNCYAYCSGDPVNYSDPSGRMKVFQYIAKKFGPSRAVPLRRKEMHQTAQRPMPSNVIDIPKREKQLSDKLHRATYSELKKHKPIKEQLDIDYDDQSIITIENYGKDHYNALYQESKAFRAYGGEMIDRGIFSAQTGRDWRIAGYNLKNFEINESQILASIIRRSKKNTRWIRPSVQNVFGISR